MHQTGANFNIVSGSQKYKNNNIQEFGNDYASI